MSRQHSLINTAKKLLTKDRTQSPLTRYQRRVMIEQGLRDLAKLRQLPAQLSLLTSQHIQQLVTYYQQQGVSDRSLANKLAAWRYFIRLAKLSMRLPSNEQLGITTQANHVPHYQPPDLSLIYHPVTLNLIELQQLFGLTRVEAAKLNLATLEKEPKQLSIHRLIAHNHRDRSIAIHTEAQRACLKTRQHLEQTIAGFQQPDYHQLVLRLYQHECNVGKVPFTTPFRKVYAQQRYEALVSRLGDKQTLRLLCREMGCQSPHRLQKEWLHELATA